MPLIPSLVDWTPLRQESLSLKIQWQECPNIKSKEKKRPKTKQKITEYAKTVGKSQKGEHTCNGKSREKIVKGKE